MPASALIPGTPCRRLDYGAMPCGFARTMYLASWRPCRKSMSEKLPRRESGMKPGSQKMLAGLGGGSSSTHRIDHTSSPHAWSQALSSLQGHGGSSGTSSTVGAGWGVYSRSGLLPQSAGLRKQRPGGEVLHEGEACHLLPGPLLPQASIHTGHSFSDIHLFLPVAFCFQSSSRYLLSTYWMLDPEPMKEL